MPSGSQGALVEASGGLVVSAEIVDIRAACQTVSVKEAAHILGVTEGFLYQRAKTHGHVVPGLPFLMIGTVRRIPRDRLLAYASGAWVPEPDGAA
jgi:excisionase family DNA binding protein